MTCRVCGRPLEDGDTILDLGLMPLANAFLDSPDQAEQMFPLALCVCSPCGTVQLRQGVDPAMLFGGDYAYHSSVNSPYVDQCHALVDSLVSRLALGPDDLVAEIGSNDGYLLARYVEHGVPAIGWEPADNLAEQSRAAGVCTRQEFFTRQSGGLIRGTARVIHANNVLAHAPGIIDILEGVHAGLAPDGLLVVETPYVAPLVAHCLYDTAYHEHLFYWSLTAFSRACRRADLAVVDVERLASHGGSLRVTVMHQGAAQPTPAVAAMFDAERRAGMAGRDFYTDLQKRVDLRIETVRAGLVDLAASGARIAGYGAAAKGTMLLNALRLPEGTIEYVVDATPGKQGRYLPGVHVPVRHPDVLAQDPPDVILVLAWNWSSRIVEQHPEFGGRWLVPMPELRDPTDQSYLYGSKGAP